MKTLTIQEAARGASGFIYASELLCLCQGRLLSQPIQIIQRKGEEFFLVEVSSAKFSESNHREIEFLLETGEVLSVPVNYRFQRWTEKSK